MLLLNWEQIYIVLSLHRILITERALRFVTRDKSTTYETLLKQLDLLSPLNQRIVKMATVVYKAIHGYKVPRGIGELLHERSELIIILEQDTSLSYPK